LLAFLALQQALVQLLADDQWQPGDFARVAPALALIRFSFGSVGFLVCIAVFIPINYCIYIYNGVILSQRQKKTKTYGRFSGIFFCNRLLRRKFMAVNKLQTERPRKSEEARKKMSFFLGRTPVFLLKCTFFWKQLL